LTTPKDPTEILESAYEKAYDEYNKDKGKSFLEKLNNNAREWIEVIATNSEKQKGVVTALITSLTKKIESPSQDVRYHKKELQGGYSARVFDTRYVTPFLKRKIPRVAMKESGWLTRSIEQMHPFTLNPPFPGKISDKKVKNAFLQILNDIEENKSDPKLYLIALFIMLINETSKVQDTIYSMPLINVEKDIEIDTIIYCLKSHFFANYHSVGHGASKLPVIAIYSLYQIMINEVERYQGKNLAPLMSHLSPDQRSGMVGDIEITDEKGNCFEGVEIKYNIPIDHTMIEDAYNKFKETPIKRYYLLTTAEPHIQNGEEQKIKESINRIKKEHGCEVIVNGVMQSIKYYLRLIRSPKIFLDIYTNALIEDANKSSEIKKGHLDMWKQILNSLCK
jgi:DNA (cytosine-5)-methyltransferase 1